ncbi:MAG: carboxymuconolactone decarboxylase family protein [Acidimicrobiales bacterium]
MTDATAGQPRIAPLDHDVEGLLPLNIFRTLAKNPKLCDRFNRFGGYLLVKGMIPARERELVVLRVGWRCGSEYEFGQHTRVGQEAGVTLEEVERLAREPVEGWSDGDRDLVAMADELCATNTVTAGTWERLAARWSEPELMELLVLAGFYRLVSGFLNGVGVQLEPGTPGWPAPGPAPRP